VNAETRFPTGTIIATRRAGDSLVQAGVAGLQLVDRHVRGDWGDISPEGREENNRALRGAGRIISSYTLTTGVRVLVLTEGDRSATTILLPEEYPLE
jgi:hypothetical protein